MVKLNTMRALAIFIQVKHFILNSFHYPLSIYFPYFFLSESDLKTRRKDDKWPNIIISLSSNSFNQGCGSGLIRIQIRIVPNRIRFRMELNRIRVKLNRLLIWVELNRIRVKLNRVRIRVKLNRMLIRVEFNLIRIRPSGTSQIRNRHNKIHFQLFVQYTSQ